MALSCDVINADQVILLVNLEICTKDKMTFSFSGGMGWDIKCNLTTGRQITKTLKGNVWSYGDKPFD